MRIVVAVLSVLSLALFLAGCGGGVSPVTTATVTIDWPGRNITPPLLSESVKVDLTGLNGYTATQIANRPDTGGSSTLLFRNVPEGPVSATITAYPQPNAGGVAQATVRETETGQAGVPLAFSASLASTVDRIQISERGPFGVYVGETHRLTAYPKNARDQLVLVPAANLTWTTSAPEIATIDAASGVATGVSPGRVTCTVTEADSHKQASRIVTVLRNPRIYVLDSGNQRIVSFTGMTGEDWEAVPTTGMAHPNSFCVSATGEIYVVGYHAESTDAPPQFSGSPLGHLTSMTSGDWTLYGSPGAGTGQFNNPQGIFVNDAGTIYVADYGNNRLVSMSNLAFDGWTTLTGNANMGSVFGVCGYGGMLFVADRTNHRIVRFNDMTGANLQTLGTAGSGVGQFSGPTSLCVPDGNLYIADAGNNRIVRTFAPDFYGWKAYGAQGDALAGPGHFHNPRGVFTLTDRIYVADTGNNRIVRFNYMTDEGWTAYGSYGAGVGQLSGPRAIWVVP